MTFLNKYWKWLLPLLFALAVLWGLIQRGNDPTFQQKKYNFIFQQTPAVSDKSLADYYQMSQDLAKQNQTAAQAVFLAVGDINLSRNVALEIKKSGDVELPFRQMAATLKGVDFSFGNLESPFAEKNPAIGGHSMIFRSPKDNIKGLVDYNFKILNLANNHAMDENEQGLAFTKSYLEKNGIKNIGTSYCGDTHNNLWACYNDTWNPSVVESKGIKIAFIGASYASINDNGKTKTPYVARIEDLSNLKSTILNLKSQADFIVVTMHAGTEYTRQPNQAQIEFAHAAIDFGADMVIGSHPHWVQTIEKYCPDNSADVGTGRDLPLPVTQGSSCKYIFYSLGNFIFDQMWSQDTREGLALKMTISKSGNCHPALDAGSRTSELDSGLSADKAGSPAVAAGMTCGDNLQGNRVPAKLKQVELIPVIIDNYSTPRKATADEAKKILEKIGQTDNLIKP